MSYNVQQDKFVFGVTPAPSPLNPNPINWRAYINDLADEINVVDEKTNLLVGTIGGGSGSYRFQKLPKSIVSTTSYNGALIGDFYEAALPIVLSSPLVRLSNGNLATIDYSSNHFNNGAIIYDCYDEQTLDPINGYWVAFRPNDTDPSLLEKIGEVIMTADYFNNGYDYSYQTPGNDNECKFIRFSYPVADGTNLESIVTTVNISGTSVGSTMTVAEVTNNFGGNTVLSLYNANAPVPILAGVWSNRTPYYSLQDDYYGMMNGVDEGWVWYGDGFGDLFSYMAGYNILTGATAFINPVTSLIATTNLNALGPITGGNFNQWESHPAGVAFTVFDNRVENNGNNNNGVTGLFSPRWTNNKIVVFLNGRDELNGFFLNTGNLINNNTTGVQNNYGYDGLHFFQYSVYNLINYAPIIISYRYKLDVASQQEPEISTIPLANPGWNDFVNYWSLNEGFLLSFKSTERFLTIGVPMWGQLEYTYWNVLNDKMQQLQSNNTYPFTVIDNRFYSLYSEFNVSQPQFGIQYDEYKLA